MAIKVPLSCLSPFALAAALLGGCAMPQPACINGSRVIQSGENQGSVQSAHQAIQNANKTGSFSSGPGITSSMTASVGMTVTRRSADCN